MEKFAISGCVWIKFKKFGSCNFLLLVRSIFQAIDKEISDYKPDQLLRKSFLKSAFEYILPPLFLNLNKLIFTLEGTSKLSSAAESIVFGLKKKSDCKVFFLINRIDS